MLSQPSPSRSPKHHHHHDKQRLLNGRRTGPLFSDHHNHESDATNENSISHNTHLFPSNSKSNVAKTPLRNKNTLINAISTTKSTTTTTTTSTKSSFPHCVNTPTRTTPDSLNKHNNSLGGFALQRLLEGCMTPQLLAYRKRHVVVRRRNLHVDDTFSRDQDENEDREDKGQEAEGTVINNNGSLCDSNK